MFQLESREYSSCYCPTLKVDATASHLLHAPTASECRPRKRCIFPIVGRGLGKRVPESQAPPRPRPYARRGRRVKILCKSGFPRLIRKRPCISCVLEMPCSNTPSQHQTQFRWAIHAGWEFCTSAHARKGLSDIFLFFGESRPPLACNAARSKPSPKQNRNGLSTESRP